MINEIGQSEAVCDAFDFPRALDPVRWEKLRNRAIDEMMKSSGESLADLARIAGVHEGQLRIFLNDASAFSGVGRYVGEKPTSEKIADALEGAFAALDAEDINPAQRCPVRVKTTVVDAVIKGFKTARALCEFVEISAPPGVGKSEGRAEAIAMYRKEEGGVPPSGVRAEGVGFAVEALQGLHGGRDQEVIGELR